MTWPAVCPGLTLTEEFGPQLLFFPKLLEVLSWTVCVSNWSRRSPNGWGASYRRVSSAMSSPGGRPEDGSLPSKGPLSPVSRLDQTGNVQSVYFTIPTHCRLERCCTSGGSLKPHFHRSRFNGRLAGVEQKNWQRSSSPSRQIF